MSSVKVFILGLLLLLLQVMSSPARGCIEGANPNIVLFLVDDMGLMDTSVPMLADDNGKPKRYPWNEWYRTPNMERLAAMGVRFSKPAVFAARDRCGEAADRIRSVRTDRYLYIRNFYPQRPHLMPSTYKDGKLIIQRLRQLHADGRLSALSDKLLFAPARPAEELYLYGQDVWQTENLAEDPNHTEALTRHRQRLSKWIEETRDPGPETFDVYTMETDDQIRSTKNESTREAYRKNVELYKRWGEQADKPNVLFILVDDMGWRDLACYGHEIHETPNIDRLAAQGMRFTNAYAACPICAPSRAAIMTGKFPSNTGFVDNHTSELKGKTLQRAKDREFLKLKEVTLAEALTVGGYQTGFLGKWHLSIGMEPRLPTDQGFDVNVAGSFWGHPLKGYFSPYQMPNLKDGPKGEYSTDRLTSEAIGVMDDFSKQGKPWLLYMSYYTVHGPLHSKPEKTKKYAEKARQAKVKLKSPAYAGMVESLDENVGRLLDWLDEKGLRKDTIIIFASDNGGMVRATENRPLRSYKGDIYEGGIRVPCIIDWPGVIQPGSVSDTPVHGVDFYATLLAMTGLPQQPEQHEDSVNLTPLLKGETDFERGPLVWHYPVGVPHIAHSKPGSVIRVGDWKYLRFYEDGREELYNLKDDIGETNNLLDSMPEKAAEMKAQLDAVLKAHNATIPTAVPAKHSRPARKKTAKKAEK